MGKSLGRWDEAKGQGCRLYRLLSLVASRKRTNGYRSIQTPFSPPAVAIVEAPLAQRPGTLAVAPLSITLYRFAAR
jgi:hypothetical protein